MPSIQGRRSDERAASQRQESVDRLRHRQARDIGCRPRVVRHCQGRDGGAGRGVGLRQVGDRAVGDEAAALSSGASSVRVDCVQRPRIADDGGTRHPQGARQRHHHHLPGADDLAQSAAHDREADRRDLAAAQGHHRQARAGADPRPARPCRHSRSSRKAGELSAPVVWRAASARHDRDGAGERARFADRRRADHGP